MTKIQKLPESVIIFGCGYVGAALATSLVEAGVRVGALTRNAEKAVQLKRQGLSEVVVENLHESAWHQKISGSYDAVVNCVSSAGGGLGGYRQSYIEGQRRIIEWTRRKTIQSYIYTGSTSVYPQDGGLTVDETADTSTASPTGQLLLDSEQVLADASESLNAWYILRLAGIYGPGRHYLMDLLKSGETIIPGVGDYFLNLIHRDDIVSAICALLAQTSSLKSGIYNLADNAPSTKEELVQWLAERLNKPLPKFDPNQVSPRLKRRGGRMPSRKISNHKFCNTFDWRPAYPDFRTGYEELLTV